MSRDLIVGRRGDSLLGEVQEKGFTIRAELGRVRVETRRITWVHFKDPPDLGQDEIWLRTGDRLSGTIALKAVRFKTDQGEVMSVPRSAIHSIVIGGGFSLRARSLG
jgi:hypothetical protein